MILWGISDHAALNGAGGLLVAGRWHSKGRPIVYTAGSSALAMLEQLVHLEVEQVPATFQLLKIEMPDGVRAADRYPKRDLDDLKATRKWGDDWLAAGATALARVPSAIVPDGFNWLINPRHADSGKARIVAAGRWPWDERLFR